MEDLFLPFSLVHDSGKSVNNVILFFNYVMLCGYSGLTFVSGMLNLIKNQTVPAF
jgi:hypothetical protein